MAVNPAKWANDSREFFEEVQGEFKKVTWPTERQTAAGTLSVVAVVIIIGLALSAVDYLLSIVMSWLLP